MMTKFCVICNLEKDIILFRKNRASCKFCEAEKMRIKRQDPEYRAKEKLRETSTEGHKKAAEKQNRYRERKRKALGIELKVPLFKDSTSKQCSKCGEIKIFDLFANDKHTKDGKTPCCRDCRIEATNRWRKSNLEKDKAYRQSEAGRLNACRGSKKYRTLHPDRYKEQSRKYSKKYYEANKDKWPAARKKWQDNNSEKQSALWRFYTAKRRANILQATPIWVNMDEIFEIYKSCPINHHVDHIVPIKGKLVSGLHVPWNLQILSASENIRKSNKFNTAAAG